jgi:hypothetical protein
VKTLIKVYLLVLEMVIEDIVLNEFWMNNIERPGSFYSTQEENERTTFSSDRGVKE